MSRAWKAVTVLLAIIVVGDAISVLVKRHFAEQQVTLEGVALARSDDVNKQAPIAGVEVSVGDGAARQVTWSGPTGYFILHLAERLQHQDPLVLRFRRSQYLPLDLPILASDRLCLARMTPIEESDAAASTSPQIQISHVAVKYSVNTSALVNAGSTVKTFRVVNIGDVPCNGHYPCSPDGRWKAAIGTSSLDAPRGNIFLNARVACIAGPCPFTRIRSDGFSRGGPTLHVAVLDWSDTTVFLFEAELFRLMSTGSTRISYPVVFGQTMHFTVPGDAEGVYIEADVDHDSIVFPLGPEVKLTWADCTESVTTDHTKAYQCRLKPGYAFTN